MKTKVKELRIKIDGLSQLVKRLKPIKVDSLQIHLITKIFSREEAFEELNKLSNSSSKEIDKTYDSLILGKAWLGKVLQSLGELSPYDNDGNRKEIKDIEPTSDTQDWIHFNDGFKDKSHIEKVDWLRETIGSIVKDIVDVNLESTNRELSIARTNTYNHLAEARFWLGFELGRIRDNEVKLPYTGKLYKDNEK